MSVRKGVSCAAWCRQCVLSASWQSQVAEASRLSLNPPLKPNARSNHGKLISRAGHIERPMRTRVPGQMVHLDEVPMSHGAAVGAHAHFAIFVDDCARFCFITGLRNTSGSAALSALKLHLQRTARFNAPLRLIQADSAREFMQGVFASYCVDNRIEQRWSIPYRQFQNGVAESHVKLIKHCA